MILVYIIEMSVLPTYYYYLPTTTTAAATTTTTTGWPSGINGRLNNLFLDPEDPGLIPGKEHGKI